MAKKGATQFQIASAAVYRFLAEGTKPDPKIESHHRRPWKPDAPITRPGSSASANFGVFGQLVGMCLGGRTRTAAERHYAARWTDELERVGIGCSEGPFSGYDTIHESTPPIVYHLTDSKEIKALARRRARAKWELVRRCSVVLDGELCVLGPGNRFDQGGVGLRARQPHSAILAHQARAWHPYDAGPRPIRNPGAAEWLLRAVRLTSWEDIREEPLRLEDVRSMSTINCWRWPGGEFAAWIEEATHGWDPALLGVVVRDPSSPEFLFPAEFLAGGNPREGGWSGSAALLHSPTRLQGEWAAGKERYQAGPIALATATGAEVGFFTSTKGGRVIGSWPDLAGLRPIPGEPRKPGPKPEPPPEESEEEEPMPESTEHLVQPGSITATDLRKISGPTLRALGQAVAAAAYGEAAWGRVHGVWMERAEPEIAKRRSSRGE